MRCISQNSCRLVIIILATNVLMCMAQINVTTSGRSDVMYKHTWSTYVHAYVTQLQRVSSNGRKVSM